MKLMLMTALVACLSLSGCGAYELNESERQTTEIGARDFAERSGGKYVSCSGQDSDGDNYVTCTTQDATSKTVEVLCAYRSRGCKLKA